MNYKIQLKQLSKTQPKEVEMENMRWEINEIANGKE